VTRVFLSLLALGVLFISPAWADPLELHYSPEERLDRLDVELIDTAKSQIDLASYALTDWLVIDALDAAAKRGVKIRVILDPRERHDFVRLGDLADTVRIKRGGALMHLKAYEIDGAVLRTGGANFSASGESAQDNDLIVIRDAAAAGRFEAHFTAMWGAAAGYDRLRSSDRRDGATMRFLIGALMIALAIAAAVNIPEQIQNADRRGGHRMVALSRIAAWPTFGPAVVRWPDPAAIERKIGVDRRAAYARFVGGRRLTP
jgi:PLD-like domain